jgi:hypothetical protein
MVNEGLLFHAGAPGFVMQLLQQKKMNVNCSKKRTKYPSSKYNQEDENKLWKEQD